MSAVRKIPVRRINYPSISAIRSKSAFVAFLTSSFEASHGNLSMSVPFNEKRGRFARWRNILLPLRARCRYSWSGLSESELPGSELPGSEVSGVVPGATLR